MKLYTKSNFPHNPDSWKKNTPCLDGTDTARPNVLLTCSKVCLNETLDLKCLIRTFYFFLLFNCQHYKCITQTESMLLNLTYIPSAVTSSCHEREQVLYPDTRTDAEIAASTSPSYSVLRIIEALTSMIAAALLSRCLYRSLSTSLSFFMVFLFGCRSIA